MKILFLSRWFPLPPDNGSNLRIYNLLHGLAAAHAVHLVSFADDPAAAKTGELATICRSVRVVQWREFRPTSGRALVGFFSSQPRSLVDIYSVEMQQAIQEVLKAQDFDLVVVSQWQMMAYSSFFEDLPTLYEEIECGVLYEQYAHAVLGLNRIRAGLTWWKQRQFLKRVLSKGQPCTVVSERERDLLASITPYSPIHMIPNGVALTEYAEVHATPEPGSLIFTGSFRYQLNYQAMLWFIERVLPLIQVHVPDVRLTITGDPAGVSLPRQVGVVQTGFVEDVRSLIARSWASIVPLQVGGGMRLKILEAMALKVPVLSTRKGVEGLNAVENVHVLIGDSPQDFARQTVTLLNDSALRSRIAENAFQRVSEN